jgi:hypothetical protein
VTVTGYPKNLTTLRDKIASKTRQPIPAVISPPITLPEIRIPPSAPEPEILSTSPPRRKPKVGKTVNFIAENPEEEARNMARLRQLIGKGSGEEKEREIKIAENIEDLKSAELAALQEAQVLAEARVIEEEKLAVPWSAPELLEEKVPIRRAPERAIIEAARTQAPRPVIIEEREPSEVTRLVARLRDIQAVPQSTPVRLIGAQHALADKIALCTGISP